MSLDILILLVCFLVYANIQAVVINGIKLSFGDGMIFSDIYNKIQSSYNKKVYFTEKEQKEFDIYSQKRYANLSVEEFKEKIWIGDSVRVDELGFYYKEAKGYYFNSFIRKSIFMSCIKCAASFWGAVTFVPFFVRVYGIKLELIPILIADIFILVYLNFYYYKKL